MLLETKFKEMVDATNPTITIYSRNLKQLYNHYNSSFTNSLSLPTVQEHLGRTIQLALNVESNFRANHLYRLRKHLILRYVVDNKELQPYFTILDTLINYVNLSDTISAFEDEAKWRNAIQAAKDLNVLRRDIPNNESEDLIGLERQLAIGYSAKFLREKGYRLQVEDGRISIEDSEQRRIVNSIEEDIKVLGGLIVAKKLFSDIQNLFDQKYQRYHLVRRVSSWANKTNPNVPVGYLLNLCVKHIDKYLFLPSSLETAWQDLLETSTAFASVFDVEPYNQFELKFKTLDTIVEFLQEITLYDSMFSLTQLRPSDVPKLLRGLFTWIDRNKVESLLGWEPNQAAMVAEKILELAANQHKPVVIKYKDLQQKLPEINRNTIKKILDIYSQPKFNVNKNFNLPTDIADKDFAFSFKPLIRSKPDEYILMNPSWCSPSFYEAVVSELRQEYKNIDNQIGCHGIEKFVKNELASRGLTYSYGEYKIDKNLSNTHREKGECDVVIETNDTIIFIEIKKKPLIRKSQAGSAIDVFLDLSKSLIEAQLQLGWHEIIIRDKGYLELETDLGKKKVQLNGRAIERIALTLSDFGGLQDRTILFEILKLMLTTRFVVDRKEDKNKLSEVHKKLDKLLKQHKKLIELGKNQNGFPFFNCWFLSLPQLLIILDDVNSNELFKNALWRTRHSSTGALNFYFEYAWARDNLTNNAPKI